MTTKDIALSLTSGKVVKYFSHDFYSAYSDGENDVILDLNKSNLEIVHSDESLMEMGGPESEEVSIILFSPADYNDNYSFLCRHGDEENVPRLLNWITKQSMRYGKEVGVKNLKEKISNKVNSFINEIDQ